MKKFVILFLIVFTQNIYAAGTAMICHDQNGGQVGDIVGSGNGKFLTLNLSTSVPHVDISQLSLLRHPDLGGLFTAVVPSQNFDLIAVPIRQPNFSGGELRIFLLSAGRAVLEVTCD